MKNMKKVWTYFVICAIAVLAAFNYHLFVFPNRFAPAGLNGICTMIQYVFGISVGYLSLIINIPLAIFTYFKVSKSMAKRSMLYVAVNSAMLLILDNVDLSRFAYYTENGTSAILGPLAAGIIWGFGYALLVRTSANSGGTDFIAAIIHKYNPESNIYWLIFTLNVCVAGISYFVYDFQIEPVILCILYSFMSSTVSNNQSKSGRSAVRFEIVTDFPEEIGNEIIHKLHHSATVLPGRGLYKGREVSMLICVVNNTQMAKLANIIRKYPNTFAIMSSVSEVVGNFKKIDKSGRQEVEILDHGDTETV